MSGGSQAATRLERALIQAATAAGVWARVSETGWTRWASATFAGARHEITLEAALSPQLDAWLAALPEHDFALSGHLVADLAVTAIQRCGEAVRVSVEALTVEDG